MSPKLLARPACPRRCEKVGKDTLLRIRRIRPGDILLTGRDDLASRAIGWAGQSPFSHAAIFVDKTVMLESIFKGVVFSRPKVLDFEWVLPRRRYIESLSEIQNATVAAVYRNELFLSGLRRQVMQDIELGKAGSTLPLGTLLAHQQIELLVDARASSMLISAAEPFLFKEYPFIADLIAGFAGALKADGIGSLRGLAAELLERKDIQGVITNLESFLDYLGNRKADGGERDEGGSTPIKRAPINPGVFCSELICEMYSSMGFPLNVPSSGLPPGMLARCPDLTYLDGVISQDPSNRFEMWKAQMLAIEVDFANMVNDDVTPRISRQEVANLRKLEEGAIEYREVLSGFVEALGENMSRIGANKP